MLKRIFLQEQDIHKDYSTIVNFVRAVAKSRTNEKEIKKLFRYLVDPDDYAKEEKEEILRFLTMLK